MPVTTGQVQNALNMGLFETETVKLESDGNSGQFDQTQLNADDNGVITYLQVGTDAPIADAEAVILGQYLPPDKHFPTRGGDGSSFLAGQTRVNRFRVRLRTQGGSDAQASARWGLGIHKDPTVAKANTFSLSDVDSYNPNAVSNDTDIPVDTAAELGNSFGGDGDYIVLVANPGAAGAETYQYDEADSELTIPVLKWDGRGL